MGYGSQFLCAYVMQSLYDRSGKGRGSENVLKFKWVCEDWKTDRNSNGSVGIGKQIEIRMGF